MKLLDPKEVAKRRLSFFAYDIVSGDEEGLASHTKVLAQCSPVYKTFKGWKEDLSKVKRFEDLPKAAKIYLNFLERYLKVKVTMVSVGKDREKTIHRK